MKLMGGGAFLEKQVVLWYAQYNKISRTYCSAVKYNNDPHQRSKDTLLKDVLCISWKIQEPDTRLKR